LIELWDNQSKIAVRQFILIWNYCMKDVKIRTSVLVLMAYAALGCFGPYLNLFYQDQGMSLVQIGVLAMIPAGMSMLAAPTWAGLADRFRLHKHLLSFTLVLSLPFALLLSGLHSFSQLLLGISLFAACFSAITPLTDNTILSNLGDKPSHYGRIRLWGSIGVGVASWAVGLLLQIFKLNFIFYIYILLAAMAALIAMQLPKPAHIQVDSYWRSAGLFIHDQCWTRFLFGSVLAGVAHMFLGYYFFIFLRDLGASEGFLGFSVAVASATDIIAFFLMPRLLKRWSAIQIIFFSNMLLVLRMALTAFIRIPALGILSQLMDGPTWGTMWAAGVNYSNAIAPRGLTASAQALYNGIFMGLGGLLAALFGGMIYSAFGAQNLFLIGACLAVLSVLVFLTQLKGKFSVKEKEMVRERIG
jgi:PPP family 3-phenylpropionic acid transporter